MLLRGGGQHVQPSPQHASLHPLRRAATPRSRVLLSSSSKDGGGPKEKAPDGSDGPGKADFSAYWSLRIKQALDNRRKYLEDIDRKGIPESELANKFEQKAEEYGQQLRAADEEKQRVVQLKLQAQRQLQEEAAKGGQWVMRTSCPCRRKRGRTSQRGMWSRRGAELRSATVLGVAMNLHRAGQVVRAVLLSPITLARAVQQQWSALFNSQRYENFLMAEGERIWYWRNRTENERWFWEIIMWDKLLLPLLCTISYQMLVPAHWFWVLVVPITFIFMQSGEFPSWQSCELWFIAYFGFYLKLWPQCAAALKGMLWV